MADASGVAAIAARRRRERDEALAVAKSYAEALDADLPLVTAVVFGSYARGDFNIWSDVDVLILSDGLPGGYRERLDLLWRHRPGGLEPVGWTLSEHQERRQRRDPIAVEVDQVGMVVFGAVPAHLPTG
ncbi:MAG: nucleotidyltransferase domain-containing protein [Acidimicrobiales bacterium]